MVRSTQIVRVSDSLPLAQSVDDSQEPNLAQAKQNAKVILRRITPHAELRCSIESGQFASQCVCAMRLSPSYLIQPPPGDPSSVVYLTISDRSYPRKLAFSYLDELAREFETSYGSQIAQRGLRPYAFVAFGTRFREPV